MERPIDTAIASTINIRAVEIIFAKFFLNQVFLSSDSDSSSDVLPELSSFSVELLSY